MSDSAIKESVYKIVNSIIDEGSDVKIGSLDSCNTDGECSPDLCDRNRKKCFKYIKYEHIAYPIDIFIRKMFESNIDEVKPFEHMLSTLGMSNCLSKIHMGRLDDEKNTSRVFTYIYDESESDFYYKYTGDGCKGFSIISIYIRTNITHANVILVENIKDFLIWNYYEPSGYENNIELKKIEHVGELCAKIANKKFIFNHKEGAQCPIGIQKLLNDYDPGYCLIFSYFWIWCVLNVIKRMTSYIPSNQWISYVEKCVATQLLNDKAKVYKRVISFAHSLYESYPTDKKSEKINNSDYMQKYSIGIDDYNERVLTTEIGKNRGKHGEQFAKYTGSDKDEEDEDEDEDFSDENIPGIIANNKILSNIYEHLNNVDKDILLDLVDNGMAEQIKHSYSIGTSIKEILTEFKEVGSHGKEKKIHSKEKHSKEKENNEIALINASYKGYLPDVQILLKKGVDIHAYNDDAIRLAAENGHLKIVQYLVEKGADMDANDSVTIISASRGGHLPVVQYLVEKGANLHANSDEAFRVAAENGHLSVVRFLVERGADILVENNEALINAIKGGHEDVVKYLFSKGADIHTEDGKALITAIRRGHLSIVKYLIDNGVDIHTIEGRYFTRDPEMLKYLKEVSETS